jgi:RimJ/RimL family protein N-acetyltransferase
MAAAEAVYPRAIPAYGLELRPWDEDLVRQAASWGERGFPYHAFDLGFLSDPVRAAAHLVRSREDGPHRHFVACEDGLAVGRVSVNLRDLTGLYIWSVHVPPEHERRGVCRRMLAGLMQWLEEESPRKEFVLNSNAYATHAHRAYAALGFAVTETRWYHDREVAAELWRVTPRAREPLARHIRFHNGRWEVRTHTFVRRRGTPMATASAGVRLLATAR